MSVADVVSKVHSARFESSTWTEWKQVPSRGEVDDTGDSGRILPRWRSQFTESKDSSEKQYEGI